MGNELSHSSGCAESWSCFIDSQPALLYIEPPPVTSLRQEHKRAIACFCLKATLQQVKQGRHFVLVHPQKSTLRNLPVAKALEDNTRVSGGRVSASSDWAVTSNFARGQLEPLCRHHTTKQKGQTQWSPSFGTCLP